MNPSFLLFGIKKVIKHSINFNEFVKNGTISRKDLKLFKPTNSVNDAFKFITNTLEKKLIRKPGIYL